MRTSPNSGAPVGNRMRLILVALLALLASFALAEPARAQTTAYADLSVTQQHPESVESGQETAYTFTVTNNGPDTSGGGYFYPTFWLENDGCGSFCSSIGKVEVVSYSNNCFDLDETGLITCDLEWLPVGQSFDVNIVVRVTLSSDVISNPEDYEPVLESYGQAEMVHVRDPYGANDGFAAAHKTPVLATLSTPAAPGKPDLSATSDTGASSTDNLTKDTTPTFTGTAEAGSRVKILVDGVQKGSATATASGTYSITTGALTPARHMVSATATDAAGNTSPRSAALAVTVDTRKPAVSGVTSPTAAAGNLTATFSERMRATTITGTPTTPSKSFKLYRLVKQPDGTIKKMAVAASVTYKDTTTSGTTISRATLNPASSLPKGNYEARVMTPAATDRAGNVLDQNPTTIPTNEQKTWRFTIG